MQQVLERLISNNRRLRYIAFARSDQTSSNNEPTTISVEEWLAKFEREKVTKADLDALIYDFLRMEGEKEVAESFRFETDLQSNSRSQSCWDLSSGGQRKTLFIYLQFRT